ncbi:MAG: hypothetical protein V1800_08530 [Candidatus Latescibacterota bacterium]
MKTSTKTVATVGLVALLFGSLFWIQNARFEKRYRDLLARSVPASVSAPEIPVRDFREQPSYQVVRVVDGDTVVLLIQDKQTSVRLIGIDTPETVHPQKPRTTLRTGGQFFSEKPSSGRIRLCRA